MALGVRIDSGQLGKDYQRERKQRRASPRCRVGQELNQDGSRYSRAQGGAHRSALSAQPYVETSEVATRIALVFYGSLLDL